MKLLLVDDEVLTREGVIASIDWEKLGITEIYQAEDGVEGLSLAKKYAPEIILCDVRMPRMTGIEMMEKIQSLYPDTVSIFMSGYSDKEYLKAAIKLHSINYVEKPLNINEIETAVIDAIAKYKLTTRSHQNETKRKIQDASSLALSLTLPENERDNEQIQQLIKELHLPINSSTFFTTWIMKFPYAEQLSSSFFPQIAEAMREYLKKYKMQMLHVRKHVQYLIFHVFGNFPPSSIFLSGLEGFLTGSCQSAKYFFIARGSTVIGVHNVYSSYQKAVLLLQSSFFFHNQSILTVDCLKKYSLSSFSSHIPDFIKSFSEALNTRDKEKCDLLLTRLLKYYEQNTSLLPNEAKDMYYRLFMLLQETMLQSQIPKLTLQPVVENAILHGIMETEKKTGTIVITGWSEGEDFILLISDDGIGMSEEILQKILTKKGVNSKKGTNIAIYNTHQRIMLLYGEDYGLSYNSVVGKGTEVQIRLPVVG